MSVHTAFVNQAVIIGRMRPVCIRGIDLDGRERTTFGAGAKILSAMNGGMVRGGDFAARFGMRFLTDGVFGNI